MYLTSLPDEVLKLVMQHAPLKDRLTSCCLVNKKLHAAAVAATDQLAVFLADNWPVPWEDKEIRPSSVHDWKTVSDDILRLSSPLHTHSMLPWLSLYGQHVTSLDMLGIPPWGREWQQLPCPNLLQLCVDECNVQLGPAEDGTPGVIPGCTKLTRLDLSCTIIDFPAGGVVDSLSSLVHLQHLIVSPQMYPYGANVSPYAIGGVCTATLPRLQQLTHITISGFSADNLLQLGALTNLKVLEFEVYGDVIVSPSSLPGLVFPASLIGLGIASPVEAGVLSVVPTGLQSLLLDLVVQGPAEGPGSLLCGLGRLQHLTRLVLRSPAGLEWPVPGPVYSALATSSNLQDLSLCNTRPPAGVWKYVFPAARMLPHLICLSIADARDAADGSSPPSAWDAADVACVVSCCPNLRMISSVNLQHGRHVSALQQLTALTHLGLIYGSSSLDDIKGSLEGLAAVTQLKRLQVSVRNEQLPMAALLPLTSLTALTHFKGLIQPHPLWFESSQVSSLAVSA